MTFNLASADREVNRLYWKESGLTMTKYCLERYSETGDKFFLSTAKTIATDYKKLDDLYKRGVGSNVKDELFDLIMALEKIGEPAEVLKVASVNDLFRALLEESEKEAMVYDNKSLKAYNNENLLGEPF